MACRCIAWQREARPGEELVIALTAVSDAVLQRDLVCCMGMRESAHAA